MYGLFALVATLLGVVGIAFIVIGACMGFWEYLTQGESQLSHIRVVLGSHLVLGLDFLVGKDIIDTLLVRGKETLFEDLAALITVVGIRIVLNHFLVRELAEIRREEKATAEKNTKRKTNKHHTTRAHA